MIVRIFNIYNSISYFRVVIDYKDYTKEDFMTCSKNNYNSFVLEGRQIGILNLINNDRKEPPNLFIIQDAEMFQEVENNFLGNLEKNAPNMLIALISTDDRDGEYTPWYAERTVAWVDEFSGNGDDYINFLIDRLIPFLEDKYNRIFNKTNTYMAGASLGGLISTYALFKYPNEFAGGIFVSSSYWYENFLNFLNLSRNINKEAIIYMDVGDQEGIGKITLGKDIVEETKKVYQIFLDKGIKKDNIYFEIKKDMSHNISFFVDRIYDGIIYINNK